MWTKAFSEHAISGERPSNEWLDYFLSGHQKEIISLPEQFQLISALPNYPSHLKKPTTQRKQPKGYRFHLRFSESARNAILNSFHEKAVYPYDVFKAFSQIYEEEDISVEVPEDSSHPIAGPRVNRQKQPRPVVKITKEMLLSNLQAVDESYNITNMHTPDLSLYKEYHRMLVNNGILAWRVRTPTKCTVVTNDYNASDGSFMAHSYVHLTRTTTELGPRYSCTCAVYKLLEGIAHTHEDNAPVPGVEGITCCHCRLFKEELEPYFWGGGNRSTSGTSPTLDMLSKKQGVSEVIELPSLASSRKFSVVVDNEASFVILTLWQTTKKYIISCQVGYCRAKQSHRRYICNLNNDKELCPHLKAIKDRPALWQLEYDANEEGDKDENVSDPIHGHEGDEADIHIVQETEDTSGVSF